MENKGVKTLALMGSKVLAAVFRFGGGILIARFFTTHEYATYSQIMLLGSTFAIIPAAFQQSFYYFLPLEEKEQWKRIILSGFAAGVLFVLLIDTSLIPLNHLLADFLNNPAISSLVPAMVFFFFGFLLSGYIDPMLICLGEEIKLAIARSLVVLTSFAAICVSSILSLKLNLLIMLLGLSSAILPVYITMRSVRLNTRISIFKSISIKEIHRQLFYSFPLLLSSLFEILSRRLDQYLISALFDPHEYAIYARGAIELPFTGIVTISIFTILIPEFVKLYKEGEYKEMLHLWREGARRIALIFFPLGMFLIFKAEPIVVFLFSEKYQASSPIFQVYAIQMFIGIALYGSIPRSTGKTDIIYKATVVFTLCNFVMSYPLILLIGPVGAALGTAASGILSMIYYLINIKMILKVRFSNVFPWKNLFLNGGISLVGMVLVTMIIPKGHGLFWDLLFSFILFLIMILPGFYCFGLLTRQELSYIANIFKKICQMN